MTIWRLTAGCRSHDYLVTSGLNSQVDVLVGSTVDKLTLFTFLVVLRMHMGSCVFRWNRGRPFIKIEINF